MAMLGVATVGATTLDPVTLRRLVQEAELIVEGVVTAVEYRMSDVLTADHVALPHTFVTFAVAQIVKGRIMAGRSLTLRFQGGPDGAGNILMVPGVPLFDVGDRDILFVRGNGTRLCPLIGWKQGRFRVLGGLLYTEWGQEVWLTRRGELAFGPSHALAEVRTHTLAGIPLEFELPTTPRARALPPGRQWLDATHFKTVLSGLVGHLQGREALAHLPPVASADIRSPFYVSAPRPQAPPAVSRGAGNRPEGAAEPPELRK
jgi:hypothetical protein